MSFSFIINPRGRSLEEDNSEGMLFSRVVNKFDGMQDHISFTSEFASSTGYLSKKNWRNSFAAAYILRVSA